MNLKTLKTHKTFEGKTQFWEHDSSATGTKMKFSTFIPSVKADQVPQNEIRGCLIWLSGLTCTDENFITKAGAQKFAAKHNLMLICPDTSPRGLDLPREHETYSFGSGAGFYVNSTAPGYEDHYRMFDYVSKELYGIITGEFKVPADRISIFGHSMGGHGALVIGLHEPSKFKSISAFSPIVNPMEAPWGVSAFEGYLGMDKNTWKAYDATELVKSGRRHPNRILIDQGTADEFLNEHLKTQNFVNACKESGQALDANMREGYDHSYYFISTFVESHIEFHAKALGANGV